MNVSKYVAIATTDAALFSISSCSNVNKFASAFTTVIADASSSSSLSCGANSCNAKGSKPTSSDDSLLS